MRLASLETSIRQPGGNARRLSYLVGDEDWNVEVFPQVLEGLRECGEQTVRHTNEERQVLAR